MLPWHLMTFVQKVLQVVFLHCLPSMFLTKKALSAVLPMMKTSLSNTLSLIRLMILISCAVQNIFKVTLKKSTES